MSHPKPAETPAPVQQLDPASLDPASLDEVVGGATTAGSGLREQDTKSRAESSAK
jgi:hypothetical protein